MSANNIYNQLKGLSKITADPDWKEKNREILFSQIFSGNQNDTAKEKISIMNKLYSAFDVFDFFVISKASKLASMPSAMVLLIIATVFGSSVYGLKASRNSIPGDSLYIAKKVSERTQHYFTFDEKQKAKLSIEFARNRTQELVEMIEREKASQETGTPKSGIDNLVIEFKSEISYSKERLDNLTSKMSKKSSGAVQKPLAGASESATPSPQARDVVKDDGLKDQDKDKAVFSANMDKDDKNIDIAGGNLESGDPASSTTEAVPSATKKALEEAEKLFDSKDYEGAIDKLEEANTILDKSSQSTEDVDMKAATAEPHATSTE